MLEIWLSVGYVLLLAILLFAFILKRTGGAVAAIAALAVGIPLWLGWEYARPAWTAGTVSGTAVRRSDPDARGNTRDIEYIFMRNQADAGVEVANEDSWWWLKRNTERVFNDAITAQDRNTEVTIMWDRWRSNLFSWYPNTLAIGRAGSWPLWSWRTVIFYGFSVVLWAGYFYAFSRLRNRTAGRAGVHATAAP
jgi:hypothetical protein